MPEEQQENVEVQDSPQENVDEGQQELSPMQQNWIFYMYAGIPWWESKKITDPDERNFLMERCYEMKLSRDQEIEREKQERELNAKREAEMEEQIAGLTGGIGDLAGAAQKAKQGDG